LIEPALENIAQWRFEPARIGDVAVNTHFEFVIDFRPDRPRPPMRQKP
jgi:outer membrane biosynthesis protein TonB